MEEEHSKLENNTNNSESVTDMSNVSDTDSEDSSTAAESESLSTEEYSKGRRDSRRGRSSNSPMGRNNPYFMTQTSFFQQTIPKQYSSHSKVVSFIEKDLFLLNHHESAPFKNISHAIEVITPYHIFLKPVDDLKLEGSNIMVDIDKEVERLKRKTVEFLNETVVDSTDNGAFLAQLLLFHEQRYFISKVDQDKRAAMSQKTPKKSRPEKSPKMPNSRDNKGVRKKRSSKSNMLLNLKTPEYSYHYGNVHKMRFKLKKFE